MAILAQLVDDVIVHKFEIKRGEMSIGRHLTNDIVIEDASVSSHHAKLVLHPNPDFPEYSEAFIEDLNSTNGTFVNNEPVVDKIQLHHNDLVRIAWNQFRFVDADAANLEKTVHMIKS